MLISYQQNKIKTNYIQTFVINKHDFFLNHNILAIG